MLAMQFIDGLIRQPAQRRAEHAHKGQPVVCIFNRSEQIHGVDDFFRGVKVPFSLDNIANAIAPKRLQVIVDVGELSKKDGNILRLRLNPLSTGLRRRSFYDLVFEPTSETLAFDSARLFRALCRRHRDDLPHHHFGRELYAARSGSLCGAGLMAM
jgi:hypothetical protein